MKCQLLGVRGSTAAPGVEFVRYGGHTACVAVTFAGADRPQLLFDAGTGLRRLPEVLGRGVAFEGTIALSHLHWDHMQGFPFCPAVDHDQARVRVVLPAQNGQDGFTLLAQSMAPPAFPITPGGLRGHWSFDAVEPGLIATDAEPRRLPEGVCLQAAEVAHKGGRTFGYRITADGASLAYVPDHAPQDGLSDAALDLLSGVDLLIHDAQFFEPERAIADLYGHATIPDVIALAERVGARRLLLFHHAPARTDDALDAEARTFGDAAGHVTVAAEGMVIEV